MFHLHNPQMDRRIPPFVRSIFFHSTSEGWGARRRWILVGRDPAITPSSGHAYREHCGGYLRGSLLLFSTLYLERDPASIPPSPSLATRSSSSPSRDEHSSAFLVPRRHPLISFRLDRRSLLEDAHTDTTRLPERRIPVEAKMSACVTVVSASASTARQRCRPTSKTFR